MRVPCLSLSLSHNYYPDLGLLSCCSVMSSSLQPYGLQPARLLHPWDSPGKNTGVGCHFLLHGIFPAQGLNPHVQCFLHWQVNLLPVSHLGSPQTFLYTPIIQNQIMPLYAIADVTCLHHLFLKKSSYY